MPFRPPMPSAPATVLPGQRESRGCLPIVRQYKALPFWIPPCAGRTVERGRGNDGSRLGNGGREATARPYRRRLPFTFLTQVAVQGRI